MDLPPSAPPPDRWGAVFGDGAATCHRLPSPSPAPGFLHVVDEAPVQPEFVRTEHGSYHGLVLFTRGADDVEDGLVGGATHFTTVRPGDLHVYSRKRNEHPHHSRWFRPVSFVSVMLPPAAVANASRALDRDYPTLEFESRFAVDDPLLTELVRQLAREMCSLSTEPSRPGRSAYASGLLHTMATHLVRHYTVRGKTQPRPPRDASLPAPQLRRVEAYVDAHLQDSITVRDLASIACLSVAHFSRAFKASTGVSPYAYVIECRMQAAARLFRSQPRAGVAAVARRVGYDHRSQFSRQFKAHHGVSPRRYRDAVAR